jgi:site-specific recombinase XerD
MPKLTSRKATFKLVNVKKGYGNLFLSYFYNKGRRVRMGIGEKIKVSEWDTRFQKMRPSAPRASEVNDKLQQYRDACETVYKDLGKLAPMEVFREEVRKEIAGTRNGVDLEVDTLLAWAEYYYNQKIESVQQEKRRNYNRLAQTLRYLRLFIEKVRNGRDIQFREVDNRFARRFRKFMEEQPGPGPEFNGLHHNEVAKVFKGIREYMKAAGPGPGLPGLHNTDGYTSKDFMLKTEKSTKANIYLTEEEIGRIIALDLSKSESLERVRDLFVIGCYTGLRWSDYKRIKPEHFYKRGEVTILYLKSEKTVHETKVPILPIIRPLLEKYNWSPPSISSQKFNDYIKIVGKRAGIIQMIPFDETRAGKRVRGKFQKWEKLSTHVARRSFITNMILRGLPRTKIMMMTGHTTEAVLNEYVAMSAEENAESVFYDLVRGDENNDNSTKAI